MILNIIQSYLYTIQQYTYNFPLVVHCNYISVLYHSDILALLYELEPMWHQKTLNTILWLGKCTSNILLFYCSCLGDYVEFFSDTDHPEVCSNST